MRTSKQPGHALATPSGEPSADGERTTIQLGKVTVEVAEVGVGYARTEIPSLIRASAKTGRAFHIRNARNPSAASALLVSPAVLEKLIFAPVRRRTLGEVLDALPFKRTGAPRVRAAVPDNAMRALRVPVVADADEQERTASGA